LPTPCEGSNVVDVFTDGEARVADWDILMTGPSLPVVADRLETAGRLHRLWTEADPQAAIDRLAESVRIIVASYHTPRIDSALMSKFPKLELVSSFGVGYDHVDAAWAGRHGIIVTHTPGVLDAEVADTAIGLTIATVRRLPQAERYLREGRWLERPFPLSASLSGRTMGILGLGRIGREIAKRAVAFGLDVVYHGRRPRDDAPYLYYPSLKAMAEAVDILMIVAPGGASTRHIVNAEILRALGPNGVLINVARGSLVDETALITALQGGTILAAGLDVFEHEPQVPKALLELDNAVLLPHVGSASETTRLAMANLVVDNAVSWMAGKGPLTPVPETPFPKGG
jgi:lactate dehydrogenase-like 2-hydroxyacid dehydrogenase